MPTAKTGDHKKYLVPLAYALILLAVFLSAGVLVFFSQDEQLQKEQEIEKLKRDVTTYQGTTSTLENQLASISSELTAVKNEDQRKRNDALTAEINAIQKTFNDAVNEYEELLKVKELTNKTDALDKLFAETIVLLAKRDYDKAKTNIAKLQTDIQKLKDSLAVATVIPASTKQSNTPPGSGYSRQSVSALGSNYLVDMVAGDLGSTRVIVDTASSGDCKNDCPVLSLGDYVSRNGAFAGINGSYFCPASYPSCAGKTNSFDTLLMNKNKTYFNSDNNVYSTVPAVIFLGGSVRFVGRSLEWGRDTGVDGVIANQPLLVSGGNVTFGGDDDPKKGSKGARSWVANKGNTVYIGVTSNVSVAENAHVLKALGMDNALNLDSGGSTALWSGGYKFGPGRNIPNAILFVRK